MANENEILENLQNIKGNVLSFCEIVEALGVDCGDVENCRQCPSYVLRAVVVALEDCIFDAQKQPQDVMVARKMLPIMDELFSFCNKNNGVYQHGRSAAMFAEKYKED